MKALAVFALCFAACSHAHVEPQLSQASRFALVSLYATKSPQTEGTGIIGFIDGASTAYGSEAVRGLATPTARALSDSIKGTWLVDADVQAVTAHRQLPPPRLSPGAYTSATGLPLVDLDGTEALARLARDLDVDVVVVVRHSWSLRVDREQAQVEANDWVDVVGVDTLGQKVLDLRNNAKTSVGLGLGEGFSAQLLGTLPSASAVQALRLSAELSLSRALGAVVARN